jgi:hypothetical protein
MIGAAPVIRIVSRLRMNPIGYKRLAFALGCLCGCLLLALAFGFREYLKVSRLRADYRYAHEIITSFQMDRDWALKGDVTNAVERLYRLQTPTRPSENPAAGFIERERQRAARDVIAYLRLKTGRNLGDEPEPWILAYGDESLKKNQGWREQISAANDEVSKGNYGKMTEQIRTNK